MDLSKALINNDDVGILKISSLKELNLIQTLKEQKLLNFSRLSKELIVDNFEREDFLAFIPKISLIF